MLTRQLRLCDCWPRSIERLVSSQWLGTKLQSTCCLSHANFFFKSTLAGKDVKKDPAFIKNGTVSVVVACWFCISNRQRSPEYRKVARVIFKATNPLCLEKYADAPQLGRFTLRDEGIVRSLPPVLALLLIWTAVASQRVKGKTIAIGKVTAIEKPGSKDE